MVKVPYLFLTVTYFLLTAAIIQRVEQFIDTRKQQFDYKKAYYRQHYKQNRDLQITGLLITGKCDR